MPVIGHYSITCVGILKGTAKQLSKLQKLIWFKVMGWEWHIFQIFLGDLSARKLGEGLFYISPHLQG